MLNLKIKYHIGIIVFGTENWFDLAWPIFVSMAYNS